MADHPVVSVGQHSIAGRKPRNDDSYGILIPRPPLITSKGIAMAIADGMSTSEGARQASETCIRAFLEDYYCTPDSWSVKTSAARVLSATNRWLHAQSITQFDTDRGLASTFTGAVIKGAQAHIFHVGDSRVSLLRGADLERLTTDHRIRASRSQDYLARAMGVGQDLDVDYRAVPVDPGDILIFTTDGLHDHLTDRQLISILREANDDLDGAARHLVDLAFDNGSTDNVTCQIVRIDAAGTTDRKALHDRLSMLPFPPDLDIGETLDGYRIVRELHASSRSQVYVAEDPETGRAVALKTPSMNFADDSGYIERFSREDWVGRLVSNPHVLKMVEPTRPRRFLYLVSDYVEGRTLAQWRIDQLRPDRQSPPLEAVRAIISEVARGLRALHRLEIIHQDLKPDNIMIDGNGVAKIIDFGSVRIAGIGDIVTDTDILGTRDYSAPEYLTGAPITNRADIYSLGVITYELLAGSHPYGKGFLTASDARAARYVPLRQFNPAVPTWMEAAIRKAIAIDPARRYDELSAFVTDLQKPNGDLMPLEPIPLAERHPVAFWRTAFFLSTALAIGLFLRLMMR